MATRKYIEGKFNADTIISHLVDHPLLEPNRYEIIITGAVDINKSILINASECGLPGKSMGSFEHSIVGPKRKIPNEEIYDDELKYNKFQPNLSLII